MRGHRYNQCLSLCACLAIPTLAGAHTILTETVKSSFAPASAAIAQESSPSPNSPVSALPPDEQGDVLMARGNYVAAIEAYQRGPLRSAVTWNKMGVAYHHLFALEQARRDYRVALFLDPRNADALNNLGALYHGEHNYKQAERTYKRALRYAPNSAVTYCNLGTTYFTQGKYKQGGKAYQKAMVLDPKVFDPEGSNLVNEGTSRRQRVAIDYYLAKAYAMAGKNEQALIYLRKALDAGFNDRRHLMEDKEFAQLRNTPEFHQLIAQQHLD